MATGLVLPAGPVATSSSPPRSGQRPELRPSGRQPAKPARRPWR